MDRVIGSSLASVLERYGLAVLPFRAAFDSWEAYRTQKHAWAIITAPSVHRHLHPAGLPALQISLHFTALLQSCTLRMTVKQVLSDLSTACEAAAAPESDKLAVSSVKVAHRRACVTSTLWVSLRIALEASAPLAGRLVSRKPELKSCDRPQEASSTCRRLCDVRGNCRTAIYGARALEDALQTSRALLPTLQSGIQWNQQGVVRNGQHCRIADDENVGFSRFIEEPQGKCIWRQKMPIACLHSRKV